MKCKGLMLAAVFFCIALAFGAKDCLAMNSYSTVTGILNVEGVYVPGATVYDGNLKKTGTDLSQISVGDEFVLQSAAQSSGETPVPSGLSIDTNTLRFPVVAVTDGNEVTAYLNVEMKYVQNTNPLIFSVTKVEPSDLGEAGMIWTGPFEYANSYKMNDVVTYEGESYVCAQATCQGWPESGGNSSWDVMALRGTMGPQGPQGAQGPAGANGANGNTVLSGTGDPQATDGADGDFYINTTTNTLFGPKAGGAWPASGTSIVGPTGAAGPQGLQGPQGLTGAMGPQGLQGPQGLTGAMGPQGLQGPQGLTGAMGPQGPQGAQGPTGATGPQGPAGSNYSVPKAAVINTGQTISYAAGDDGDFQPGVVLPNRFTNNGNGTVTDNLTGLIWLKNAECFGLVNWTTALSDANNLKSGSCGLTDGSVAGNWRLPNRNELRTLVDYSQNSPALPRGNPFTNVQSSYYWSSTTYAPSTTHAWYVNMYDGSVLDDGKTHSHYVWPVRGGR